jgi:hypothetical protein
VHSEVTSGLVEWSISDPSRIGVKYAFHNTYDETDGFGAVSCAAADPRARMLINQ